MTLMKFSEHESLPISLISFQNNFMQGGMGQKIGICKEKGTIQRLENNKPKIKYAVLQCVFVESGME